MTRKPHASCTAIRLSEPSSDPRRRALLRGAVLVGIAAASSLLARSVQASALEVGQQAPPLVLHTLDGRSIATRELIGQVVIATFWATWCDPCREELPLLSAYAALHAQQGLQVLGFSLDGPEDLPKVREVAATSQLSRGTPRQSLGRGLWPYLAHPREFRHRPCRPIGG